MADPAGPAEPPLVERWAWLAKPAAAVIWLTWLVGFALGDGTFDVGGGLFAGDHLAFYTAARFVRDGRAAEMYDLDALFAFETALFPPGRLRVLEAMRNPPFYALPYLSTCALPYRWSAGAWAAAGLGAFALGVRGLRPAGPSRAVGWGLTFYPVFCVVCYGQNTLLGFAIFALTYRLLAADRRFAAGLAAGLLWYKPPLLIGLIVWAALDWKRLWPCAAGAVVTGAALVGGSYLIVPDGWEAYWRFLGDNVRYSDFDQWKLHNARAFWRLLLPGDRFAEVRIALTLVCTLAGVAVFARLWAARRTDWRADLPVLFGAAVALTLWASPHAMVYDWALAIVPAVLWWDHAPRLRPLWRTLFAAVWLAFLAGTPVNQLLAAAEARWLEWPDPVLVQFTVPVVAVAGWVAARRLAAADTVQFPSPGGTSG